MKNISKVAFVLMLGGLGVLFTGCTHTRYSSIADVPEPGTPVRTTNRYRLVGYRELRGDASNYSLVKDTMEKNYPKVFSANGLPIYVSETNYRNIELSGLWTLLFPYLCSCGTLPMVLQNEHTSTYKVRVDGQPSAEDFFDIRHVKDSALTVWSPIAWFCHSGAPSTKRGQKAFYRGTTVENFTWLENKVKSEAIAYATAVKLQDMERAGKMSSSSPLAKVEVSRPVPRTNGIAPENQKKSRRNNKQPLYDVALIERNMEGKFGYAFELEMGKDAEWSLKTLEKIKRDFRKNIRDDYVQSYVGASVASTFVDFPLFNFSEGKITGKAVVMSMVVDSMKYDPLSRTGHLSVRMNPNQFEETRRWIRRNIETLARDKNIALVTGEIPPAAKFYLGREELKDGNILEIEFKTE